MENNGTSTTDLFRADTRALDSILEKYPWFTTARIRRSALSGEADAKLSLTLLTKPWPASMLHEVARFEAAGEPAAADDVTSQVIERFLAEEPRKVVPTDDTPTGDVSEDSSVFVPEEDLDTEELERIYRDQGLELMNDDVAEITGEVLGTVDQL